MTEPLVAAIMLVSGREAMVRRAVASFRAQSYSNAVLIVWDTGAPRVEPKQEQFDRVWWQIGTPKSIGAMRNDAIKWAVDSPTQKPDICMHADSDDVMHANRMAEQVALLQSSGADAVGYRECAFFDTRPGQFCGAWIYNSPDPTYAIGASLMYWRRTWNRTPFNSVNIAEDRQFVARVNCMGVSSLDIEGQTGSRGCHCHGTTPCLDPEHRFEPRLICGIHGSNTANYGKFSRQTWRREASLDRICQERMAL